MGSRLRHASPYIVMLAIAGFLWWAATLIDVDTGGRIGPDWWPKAIVAFLGLLCAYEIGKRLVLGTTHDARGIGAQFEDAGAPIEGEGAPAQPAASSSAGPALGTHPRMLIAGIALVLAYVVAVSWLGFFVTTALFLGVFPWAGGLRRPVLASALGVAGSLMLVVIFMRVAYISLPLGEGPFREISLGLMRLIGVR